MMLWTDVYTNIAEPFKDGGLLLSPKSENKKNVDAIFKIFLLLGEFQNFLYLPSLMG
jgi:hypothetical protein